MRRRRGMILLLTLMVLGAIIFFSSLYLSAYVGHKQVTQHTEDDLIAAAAADAGIDDAVYELQQSSAWQTGFSGQTLSSGATYTVTFDSTQTYYSTSNVTGTASKTGYGGQTVPAATVHLVSVGSYGTATHVEQALVQFANPFNGVFSTQGGITFNGSALVLGAYHESWGYGFGGGGNLQTNSTAAGAVTLNGKDNIYGTVTVGVGGSTSTAIVNNGSGTISSTAVATTSSTPEILTATAGTSQGDLSVTSGTVSPGTYGNMTLGSSNSDNVYLAPGTYVVTGDLTLNGTIHCHDGTVKIYVSGNVTVGNYLTLNSVESSCFAESLQVYGGSNCKSVTVGKNDTINWALYAPNAAYTGGANTQFAGAITANTCSIGDGSFAGYDSALATDHSYYKSVIDRW